MEQKNDKTSYYTLILIPHGSGRPPLRVRLPQNVVKLSLLILLGGLIIFGSSLSYSAFLSARQVRYGLMVAKEKKLDEYVQETDRLKLELQDQLNRNNEIRRMLGLKEKKPALPDLKLNNSKIVTSHLTLEKKIEKNLQASSKVVDENKKSLDELMARVKLALNKMASAPSTWPIKGKIVSWFGYRSTPWRGLHTGVDIDAPYGAPVQVTAPGVVSYVGWRTGYGKVVEVTHGGAGVTTRYAHLCAPAVLAGARVERGQIVGYVGLTGFSTGSHLHYEILKAGAPINPVGFLNLNVQTAARYLIE